MQPVCRGWVYILVTLASLLFAANAQEIDPIKNMCTRFDHQSVVKNNTLYIDGGRQTFRDAREMNGEKIQAGKITCGYNNYIISIDLSKSWDWKTNISEKALEKKEIQQTETFPPVLSRGAFFYGSDASEDLYLWGGTTSWWNQSFPGFQPPKPARYSLWSYDPQIDTWGQFDTGSSVENRPSSGSYAEVRNQNLAFYFNGQLDSGSQNETTVFGNDTKVFLKGMIVLDLAKQTARNLSTDVVVGDRPRTRGRMQYIEDIGGKGIIVQIGGNQKAADDLDNEKVGDLVSLAEVDVFDVASLYDQNKPDGQWYKQSTTGDIPAGRVDFCLVLASALDRSSANIYLYGGRGSNGNNDIFFDDLYILSIPSFTWTKVFESNKPRAMHTCHRVGGKKGRTMITVGGIDTWNSDERCDWHTAGVGVLDMSQIVWGSYYDANAADYQVPLNVTKKIGGDEYGRATMKQPAIGFDQEGLAKIFNGTTQAQVSRNATESSSQSSKTRTRPIVIGGIIGGVAMISAIGILAFYYRHRLYQAITRTEWPFAEMDGSGKTDAEMDASARTETEMGTDSICWELPAVDKPVELSARCSNPHFREKVNEPQYDPPPWAPPVTDEGTPF